MALSCLGSVGKVTHVSPSVILKTDWLIHPAACKFRNPPPSSTGATSVNKKCVILPQFQRMQTRGAGLLLCSLSACFCTLGCEWRAGGRGGVLRQAGGERRPGPPSHNSCSVIVASADSIDFWEGTVEKYTSFSALPAAAISMPKNRGGNRLSSCPC